MIPEYLDAATIISLILFPLAVLALMVRLTRDADEVSPRKIRRESRKIREQQIVKDYFVDDFYTGSEVEAGQFFTDKDFTHIFIVYEVEKDGSVTIECMSRMSREDFMSHYRQLHPRNEEKIPEENLNRQFYI